MQVEFPGLFDLQINGFAGVDFMNPSTTQDDVSHALDKVFLTGVTCCLPTLITSSLERFAACAKTLSQCSHPAIAGFHMEGPYISSEDGPRGAHPRQHVIPASVEDFQRRQEAANGKIKLVTLAPEVPGAIELIEHLVDAGVRAAIGHTAASPEQIRAAVKAGATLSTHLGNGCASQLPRHPNFIWEQLADDELFASLIVDGHHLPPATVKAMIRAKSPQSILLVTDAVAAAGSTPGDYELNGMKVTLDKNGRVFQPGTPRLAGSSLTLDRAIANTVEFTGLTLEEVLPMASTQPAAYLGLAPSGKVVADWVPAECRLSILKVIDTAN